MLRLTRYSRKINSLYELFYDYFPEVLHDYTDSQMSCRVRNEVRNFADLGPFFVVKLNKFM